jgi:hypothetical protein
MAYIRSKGAIVLISIIFLIVGLGLLFVAKISFSNSQQFVRNSVVATGNVTDIVQQAQQSNTNGQSIINYTYAPKISFTGKDGTTYTFISSTSANPSPYHNGESIKILYDQKNPYNAEVDSYWDLWGLTIALFSFGVVFSILGIIGIIFPGILAGKMVVN